jgi:hypothetical protein
VLLPDWHRSRWNLPEVGVSFSPEELARRAEWYFQLDGLVFLQKRLEKQVRSLSKIDQDQAASVVDQIKGIVELAGRLLASAPELSDRWLDRDRGMKRYIQELLRRAEAPSAANAADAAGSGQAAEPNQ